MAVRNPDVYMFTHLACLLLFSNKIAQVSLQWYCRMVLFVGVVRRSPHYWHFQIDRDY